MNRLEMANAGLLRVGDRALQSLDEPSSSARIVKLIIEAAIRETIAESGWVSCRKRDILVPLADKPLFGYEYEYELPADYIRNLKVMDENNSELSSFTIEGRKLLCDVGSVRIIYLAEPTNLDDIDPLLGQCIALKIALKLAYPKTKSKTLVESIQLEYERLALKKAMGINSLEKIEPTNFEEASWLDSRHVTPR